MRTNKFTILSIVSIILIGSIFLTACQKNDDPPVNTAEIEVSFTISTANPTTLSLIKSAAQYALSDAIKIVITIQNSNGTPTKYTATEIKILKIGDNYYSQKITLKKGDYKLTEFDLLDSSGNTIYAAPLAGSQEAQNVNNPLPIIFAVSKDEGTHVCVEVLSTAAHTPDDFGFSNFPIVEVKTFSFMIGVTENETDKILSAKLTVSNGSYSYVKTLDSVLNNIVILKAGLGNYNLKIQKIGYGDYNFTFTEDSLKTYQDNTGNLPLLIVLEKLTVTDFDGNVYKAVQIGDQIWMAENLKTTHYSDGRIALDYAYNNNPIVINTYGRRYNWYTMMDGNPGSSNIPSGVQGLSPTGWHIPSAAEWHKLRVFLGGEYIAGAKLMETGSVHWLAPNILATNETGFTALPTSFSGDPLTGNGWSTVFWSASEYDVSIAYGQSLLNNRSIFIQADELVKAEYFSVRCVKD